MRRTVCALAMICGLLAPAAAQSQTTSETFTPGVKIGIDFSSLPNAGDVLDQVVKHPSTETSSKTGVMLDGFITVPVWNKVSFQPELAFVMKGVKLNQGANNGTVTASLRYIEFPMLIRYNLAVGSHSGYVMVGPTFGVKAGTSAKLEGTSQTQDINIDSAIRTFDGGIAFAGGADYGRYVFEVRYTQGFSDVGSDAFPHTDGISNRVFAIMGGIRLK